MSWVEEQWWFGLEDLVLEARGRANEARGLFNQNIWVTKEGKPISITSMSDQHLYNCIKMIEEGRLNRRWALPKLKAEQKRRWDLNLKSEV